MGQNIKMKNTEVLLQPPAPDQFILTEQHLLESNTTKYRSAGQLALSLLNRSNVWLQNTKKKF